MTKKTDKVIQLDEYLSTKRIEWTDKIKDLTISLKRGEKLEEVSAYTLSYRQILVENLATMSSKIRSLKWIEYFNYDYKLSDKQKEKFIEADLADDTHIYDLLVSQKSFIEGSIKTLDNMGFAIKNRLDISRL
jgi:hypothetical protein